jgi:tetratricopeptide (TPR) repeat protein
MENFKESANALEKSLILQPENVLAQQRLLEVLYTLEILITPYSEPEGLSTETSKGFYSAGRHYLELGDLSKTVQEFQQAIQASSDEVKATSGILQSLLREATAAFYSKNHERVVMLLEIIITIDSNVEPAWRFLSSAYYQIGRHEDALNAAEHLIALTPTDAEAWYELGKRYAKLEQFNLAAQAFNRTLELNEKFKAARRELKKISMEQS